MSVNREAPLPDQAGTAALAEAEAWQTALALLNKGAADGDGHMHAILGALYAHGLGVTTPTQAGADAGRVHSASRDGSQLFCHVSARL